MHLTRPSALGTRNSELNNGGTDIFSRITVIVLIAVTWLGCFLVYPTFRLWLLSPDEIAQLPIEDRLTLFHQATVPGIDLAGGYALTMQADAARLTDRAREQTLGHLISIWRTRLLDFGILEPEIIQNDAMSFQVHVPISADTGLVRKMLQQSGRVTLHLFKDGNEVQALRQRIDNVLQEKTLTDSTGTSGKSPSATGAFSRLLASLTVDEEIIDIVVKEENLTAVRTLLADSTVKQSIRGYNLANPPAGAFTWASEPIERNGQRFYPLYFINQDVDLNAQPLSAAQVDEASEVTAARGAYAVRLTLQEGGRESLANLSDTNTGNRMAIKMDGQVHMTLTIQGRIPDGRVELPGGNTVGEARALSVLLVSDILPIPVEVTSAVMIPPSVQGDNAVRNGLLALGAGIVLMSIFFIVLYRATGGIVALGFVYHLLMTVALLRLWILAGIAPLLTLSSLVAILLSMLIFAIVHIWCFEQIKESLKENTAVRQTVASMFDSVQPALIWIHVLLLLVSIGCIVIGSEALTDFGLALFAGVGSAFLTFFVWTRTLLSALTEGWDLKKLSI
ncbi:MAG: hypothetical protein QGI34_16855 [Candidatus Latescibacteria bacterium]|nr:hypothetical protein [Candidatus Latescibacterota bacterium]